MWSREKRKAVMFRFSTFYYYSYLGNMMLEYPPNSLPLWERTKRTIGPRRLSACRFFDRNWLPDALNFNFRSHLKGRTYLILISVCFSLPLLA